MRISDWSSDVCSSDLRPCYLLSEGYAPSFQALMEETDWDSYGTGNYEKCANCMVHCGYEATAVTDTVMHPLKALRVWLKGPETEAPMAPDIPLDNQRPAKSVFEDLRSAEGRVGQKGDGTGEYRWGP